jgi:hypothetical protein
LGPKNSKIEKKKKPVQIYGTAVNKANKPTRRCDNHIRVLDRRAAVVFRVE